eukprot:7388400-Prymnesium_polylepis.2
MYSCAEGVFHETTIAQLWPTYARSSRVVAAAFPQLSSLTRRSPSRHALALTLALTSPPPSYRSWQSQPEVAVLIAAVRRALPSVNETTAAQLAVCASLGDLHPIACFHNVLEQLPATATCDAVLSRAVVTAALSRPSSLKAPNPLSCWMPLPAAYHRVVSEWATACVLFFTAWCTGECYPARALRGGSKTAGHQDRRKGRSLRRFMGSLVWLLRHLHLFGDRGRHVRRDRQRWLRAPV